MWTDIDPLAWLDSINENEAQDWSDDDEPAPKRLCTVETRTESNLTVQEEPLPTIPEETEEELALDELVVNINVWPHESLIARTEDNEIVVVLPPIDTPPPLTVQQAFDMYQTQPPTEEDWQEMTDTIKKAEEYEATAAQKLFNTFNGLTDNEWNDLLQLS